MPLRTLARKPGITATVCQLRVELTWAAVIGGAKCRSHPEVAGEVEIGITYGGLPYKSDTDVD